MLVFPFFFLRSTVSNGEILQERASLQHNSYSGRAEDSDLEVCFNFPDSWLPIIKKKKKTSLAIDGYRSSA